MKDVSSFASEVVRLGLALCLLPQPGIAFLGLFLRAQQKVPVFDVGLADVGTGIAEAHKLPVDEQALHVHIGEEPALLVFLIHIEVETHLFQQYQALVKLCRLSREELRPSFVLLQVRRLDAEVVDYLAVLEHDGVAVDYLRDDIFFFLRLTRVRTKGKKNERY